MPEVSAIPHNPSVTTEMLQKRQKAPVDSQGRPLPIRKSGYDALDKNSFLKLLVTQLSKQDPTNPMNDRDFIAQMAQFSSLEQMNNVANSMHKLRASQASQLIGKSITGKDFVTEKPLEGIVTSTIYQPNGEVLLKVGGRFSKFDDVTSVTEAAPLNAYPARQAQSAIQNANVSRETLTTPATSPLQKQAALSEKPLDAVSSAQATEVYRANQKAANVSRETLGQPAEKTLKKDSSKN